MKINSQILLVLTVLAIAVNCAPTPTDCATADTAFMLYLKSIQADAVKETGAGNIGDEATSVICKAIWAAKTGTDVACCDPAKINAAFALFTATRTTAWTNFVAGVVNFNKNFNNINRLLYNADSVTADVTAINAADAKKALLSGLSATDAVAALSLKTTYIDNVSTFKTSAPGCYALTMTAVGNAICHGCSAKSGNSDIVTATGAISMSLTSGTALFAACSTTWQFIDSVGLTSQIIAAINNQRGGATPQSAVATPYFGATYNTDTLMMPAWKRCAGKIAPETGDGKCVQADVSGIVQSHFNIKSPVPRLVVANLIDASFDKGNTIAGNNGASTGTAVASTGSRILVVATDYTGLVTVAASGGLDLTTAPIDAQKFTITPLVTSSIVVPTAPTADDLLYGSGSVSGTAPPTASTGTAATTTSVSFVTMFSTIAITMITMLNLN